MFAIKNPYTICSILKEDYSLTAELMLTGIAEICSLNKNRVIIIIIQKKVTS
jgi:hypothetical protein